VEYFVYCRDREGSGALRDELVEAHWAFMDGYAEGMIARGPTFLPDETPTGSVHIVDLADGGAARVFAFDEPNYRAGVYREVLIRRWSNLLGRTMWEFGGAVEGYGRFLVIGHGKAGMTQGLRDEDDRYLVEGDGVIVAGPLLSEDGGEWTGTGLMVEAADGAAAEALLADSPAGRAGTYDGIEVHAWEFGGRR
jgi:uncharacterized protein YciI